MTAPNKMAKRAAAGTLALAVCFTGGVIGAGAASAAPGFTFSERISGPDRTATAIAASQFQFDGGSDTVIIVERDAVVDGLTASYAAGLNSAPILYVDRQGVPDQVATEIDRLNATRAILVGGTAVLPQAVQTQLESAGLTVTRQSGPDRYATAAAVALAGPRTPDKVIVASGEVPADALASGPIAYALNYPLVLTRPDTVPTSTRSALDSLGSGERLAIGGTVRISESVYNQLGDTKRRVSGANRQQTAIALANIATGELGFNTDRVALVSDADRAAVDALVASPVAGENLAPLLFTAGTSLGSDTTAYLQENAAELTGTGYIFGGTNAVPQSVADEATAASQGVGMPPMTGNQTISVVTQDDVTLTVVPPADESDVSDDRVYGATGLDDDLVYRVTLVDSDNVTDDNGTISFEEDGTTGLAAAGDLDADITIVNGAPTNATPADDTDPNLQTVGGISPINGAITFRVDGQSNESLVPVVYVDGGANTRLEIDDDGLPTEAFGVGGEINYQPEEADAGAITAASPITEVDKDNDQLVAEDTGVAGLYNYDSNDLFYDGAVAPANQLTLEEFEAILTEGDELGAGSEYRDNPSFQSTFVLTNLTPAAPVAALETAGESTVELTLTGVDDDATVTVYGAEDPDQATAGPNNTAFDDTDEVATAATDEDEDTAGFQVTVTGLDADTEYDFYATQTLDGEESDESNLVDATTTQTAGDVTLTSVTPTDVNDGVGTTNTVIFTFSEAVTVTDQTGFTISPAAQPGIVYTSTTAVVGGANNNQVTVTFGTALNDATNDVTYNATVEAGAVNEVATGTAPNAELTGTFAY